MAVFVQDSFTDSDFTLLQNHSPDTGGAWQPLGIGTPDTANCVTVNNTLQSASGGDSAQVYRNAADPAAAEYDISAVWTVADATNEFRTWGLYARMTPTGTGNANVDRYQVQYIGASATGDRDLVLQKVVAGTTTTLDILEGINYQGQTITVRLEVRDSVKRVLVDDSEVCSSADNEITQVGRAGVSAPANGSGNFTDDFSADTVSVTTPEVTASIPLALDVAAESATDHEATASIALDLDVAPSASVTHQAQTTISLTLDAAAQAEANHQVTAALPLDLDVSPEAESTPGVTAPIPLALDVAAASAITHEATVAISLALDVSATTTDPQAPLINLDFVALAPVFAHGSPTAPEFHQRVATSPEFGHGDAGEPEFAARAAGEPAFAHGDTSPPKFKPRTALAPAFAHGDPSEPTT